MNDAPDESGGPDEALYNVQPCLRDPLFGLLKDRWRLSPLRTAALFFVVFLCGNLLFAAVSNNALPREGLYMSFAEDKIGWVLFGFLVPVGAFLAMRLFGQVEGTFERLHSEGIVQAPLSEYNAFLRRIDARYNSVVLHVAALAAGMAALAYNTAVHQFNDLADWLDLGMGVGAIYQFAVGLVAWYAIHVVLIKLTITAFALHRVFDWPVRVQPMHPDGCSGFRLFTDLAVTIALFAAVLGTGVALIVLTDTIMRGESPASGPMLVAALVDGVTPFVFVTCLHRAHKEMKAARYVLLERIHHEFQSKFARLHESLESGDMDDEAAEEALHLEQVHMMVKRMPVWPTNIQIIAQIAASVAFPLALLVIQVFLEKALRMP